MRPMPKDPRFENLVFKFSLGVVGTNHCPLGEPASDRVFTVEERTKSF